MYCPIFLVTIARISPFFFAVVVAASEVKATATIEKSTTTTTTATMTQLSNMVDLPLVGLGVGNLAVPDLQRQVPVAVNTHDYALVDTAHASRNEAALAQALSETRATVAPTIHVITKVWYTYLGYNRTTLSVQESLRELNVNKHHKNNKTSIPIQVHMLLHWPRCNEEIHWMHCEAEEQALPQQVKALDEPPHLHKESAYLEAWSALQDMYTAGKLASIGVSNFNVQDLQRLEKMANIMPHIIQLNVWSLLFDPQLVKYCRKHDIHIQVYNVMNGIIGARDKAPFAFEALWTVAKEMTKPKVTASQVVLKWLTQRNISVIPRTSNAQHLESQSPGTIAGIPHLTTNQMDLVERAAKALLTGRDLHPPTVRFVNQAQDGAVYDLYWKHAESGEYVAVHQGLRTGDSWDTQTFPGHTFVVKHIQTGRERDYTVTVSYGQEHEWALTSETDEEEEEL